jgi:eukaryotic-like serine/threonine-protein kinase
MDDARIGAVLQGRYRVLARLGQGGVGVVYRGERIGLERPVAIKFLSPSAAAQKQFRERFEREAMAMSKLRHPHCVPVIDFGLADLGGPYIVMELAAGKTLGALLDAGPLPPVRAVRLCRQVLAGLAHAHAEGIVHRDLKPENILVEEVVGSGDHARILDFGFAKLLEGASSASWSTASIAVGTPSYMSPEQARGEEVDVRTDLYSAGILLFEMLTGKRPFIADDAFSILQLHLKQPPPALRDIHPAGSFSKPLEAVVRRALSKQPAERHASALEMADALLAVPEGRDGTGPSPIIIESERERAPAQISSGRPPRGDEAAVQTKTGPTPSISVPVRARRGLGGGVIAALLAFGVILGGAVYFALRPPKPGAFTIVPDAGLVAIPDAGLPTLMIAPPVTPDAAVLVVPDATLPQPIDAAIPDAPLPIDAPLPVDAARPVDVLTTD